MRLRRIIYPGFAIVNTFIEELNRVFDGIGIKTVTATDVSKDAYVVSRDQKAVLEKARKHPGIFPDVEILYLHVLNSGEVLTTSYYDSIRGGSGRVPETRMGRDLVSWVRAGDRLVMATDGVNVFVCKLTPEDYEPAEDRVAQEERVVRAFSQIDRTKLLERAKSANPRPEKSRTETSVYERDPAVRAWVTIRSDHSCEMLGCDYSGFMKADGSKYIETHHIIALGEGGGDNIANMAALCPNCHREAHYSVDREQLAEKLRQAIGDGT